eukprot:CAMPEP_0197826338 /NCGR_PEP_ID=MMETSP1437-20131217/3312_1 /TAXON_ID=49252 ORGANISM="Eucampia antarctica, Strain CCMP1452" /NCGR_SAMPLE_ID=MMETSP1437 /ASSEMBLY_ACC=CAM_ASM_001096 /LENGTH=208 /DNA_ID=CAMNT_0043426735 /DNA_START=250 /DNA_END=876 /DNA_ORIENTATION=+
MLSSISSQALRRVVAVRGLATAAEHRPVIDLYGLSARYANATYIAASKQGVLEQVEGELQAVHQTAKNSAKFSDFLDNPLISRDDKAKQIHEMFDGSGVSQVTLNLLDTLAGNARLNETGKVISAYEQLMKAKRGEVEATIISADPLTKAQTEAITSAMKSQVPGSGKVILSTEVDPSILGGLQVQIGDKFLDLSVVSRIDDLKRTAV